LAAAPIAILTLASVNARLVGVVAMVMVLCFVVGYVLAVQSHRITGNYPWNMPPIFWAFAGAILPVLGFVVQSIACFTTTSPPANSTAGRSPALQPHETSAWTQKMAAEQDTLPVGQEPEPETPAAQQPPQQRPPATPGAAAPGGPPPAAPPPEGADQPQQWPEPLGPEAFQQPAGPHAWQPPAGPAPAAPPTPTPMFGWYPDPTGRHEQRYWDGRRWSHRVADNGVRTDDPEGAP
jgi:hypothetical protein